MATHDLLEREAELDLLGRALADAAGGRGSAVVVVGEAGIGKSTLVNRFAGSLDGTTDALIGLCDDLTIPRPLAPFRDLAGAVGAKLTEAIHSGASPHEVYPLLLDELSGPRPTVLVLEDVHWADDATLDAATFVARRIGALPAVLIMTMREGEVPPGEALDAMLGAAAGAGATFVQLHPLSQAAVESLAAGTRTDVYAATGGNPFLVTELLCSDDGPLPATVANAVLGRVTRLEERARVLVELLAVVPGRVPTTILDLAMPDWATAAEDPERRRLLEVSPTHVRFRHELVRQAILASLSAVATRQYHGCILQALLVSGGDPADIVHHGEAAGAEETVAAHVLPAARRAAALESNREAYAHYRRALEFMEQMDARDQALVLEEYAKAAYRTRRLDEALAGIGNAIRLNRARGDDESVGRCLRCLSRLRWFAGQGEAAHQSAREAISILEPLGPSEELAAAYSGLARLAMLRREINEAESWATKALDFGDDATRVQALVTLGSARLLCDPDADGDLREAHEWAHAVGDREEAVRALVNLAYGLMNWVRTADALAASREAVAYSDRYEVHHMAPYNILTEAWLEMRAGHWAEAERIATAHAQTKVTVHRLLAETILAELAVRRGDDDAERRLDALAEKAEETGELQRLIPVFELSVERALLLGGEAPIARMLEHISLDEPPHAEDVVRLAAWAAIAGEDVDLPMPGSTPWAAAVQRDWRAAADAFGEAGWPYDRALMLSLAGDEDALLEGIAIAQRLGAAPLTRRLTQQLRELGARVPRGPRRETRSNGAGLTGRQLEVLALLGEGLTNAEIADRLVVSPRTAEHHVAAVLQKLRAPSRRDAVRRAVELGVA
jgi:DNA-binding CsgD family transcriptional regulator/tetratricopeptide (TPR) repeat protein/GTPase SAR1 family protein